MGTPTSPIQPVTSATSQATQAAQTGARAEIAEEAMSDSLQTLTDQFSVNTMQIIRRNGETLEERIRRRVKPEGSDKKDEAEEPIVDVEAVEQIADYFENRYPDMKSKTLKNLKDQLSSADTAEDVLDKVLSFFPDPVQADEAINFLLRVIPDDLKEKILEAKGILHKRFNRQIRAGKNVFEEASKFAQEGLGSATELRQMYAEMSGNPKEPLDLFEEFLIKFSFDKMRQAISFWLHALGADLNKKGSSIEKGELHRLITEARTLQAILGVYRYFASKQRELIISLARKGEEATPQMSFENLSKLFVRLLQDKYPSPEKILFLKNDLNISSSLQAQESVLSVMCAGLKGVSPRLYRNSKHKDELFACFLKALEAIEEILEEDEEGDKGKGKLKSTTPP